MQRLLTLAALALAAFASTPAHAFRVSLVGAGNFSTPESNPSVYYSAKPSFGGGGLVEFSVLPLVGLETGALWVPRKYEVRNFGYNWTTSQDMVQVPLLFRIHFLDAFSVGFGGYYSKYRGNLEYQNTRNSAVAPVQASYAYTGFSDDDYGAVASLAFYSSLGPVARVVLDARYVYGLKDNDLLYPEKKFRDVEVLVGLQFGL